MIQFSSPLFLFGIVIVVIVPITSTIFTEACTIVLVPVDPPECEPPDRDTLADVGGLCKVGTVVEYCTSRYEAIVLGKKLITCGESCHESRLSGYDDIFSDENYWNR